METVFDYFYLGTSNLVIENAVPIFYLSDYLGIEELNKQNESFIVKSIQKQKSKELAILYLGSRNFGIEEKKCFNISLCLYDNLSVFWTL